MADLQVEFYEVPLVGQRVQFTTENRLRGVTNPVSSVEHDCNSECYRVVTVDNFVYVGTIHNTETQTVDASPVVVPPLALVGNYIQSPYEPDPTQTPRKDTTTTSQNEDGLFKYWSPGLEMFLKIAVAIMMLYLVINFLKYVPPHLPPTKRDIRNITPTDKIAQRMILISQESIMKQIRVSSAEFPEIGDVKYKVYNDYISFVSYIIYRNSIGERLRREYYCVMQYNPKDDSIIVCKLELDQSK